MTLKDFTARVAQGVKRVTHFSATVALSERKIKRYRKVYLAAAKRGDQGAEGSARQHIIYWKARKLRAEDLRRNWRDILKRRRAQKARWLKNHPVTDANGFAIWENPDGGKVPVSPAFVPIMLKAKTLGWSGWVNSGVRTAALSIELCYGICGAPSCAGTCAGATSNHNCEPGCPGDEGAIDVQDYYKFKAIMQELGNPLRNDLPADPVHFSRSGH